MPLVLAAEGLDRIVLKYLHLPQTERRMQPWEDLVSRIKNPLDEITIHVVGKYVGYEDSYKSLNEALYHGGFPHRLKVNIKWIEAEALEEPDGAALLDGADGILVPGGFGNRGTRGMMKAAQIARERRIPYFGICYGFQWATVEYARNVAGLADADSTECNPDTPTKVIYKLRDLLGVDDLGGTMRLGSYACELTPGSLAQRVYGTDLIHERHRHRYEFNCLYERTLTEHGLRISGRSPDGKFVEIAELPGHPWYLAVQFHPEFKSKPTRPHPLFAAFVGAAYQHKTAQRWRGRSARGRAGRVGAVRRPAPTSPPDLPDPPRIMLPVTPVTLGDITIGGGSPLVLIAGPCVIESEPHATDLAGAPRRDRPARRACRSSSRRRTTRRTARRAARSAAPASTRDCASWPASSRGSACRS